MDWEKLFGLLRGRPDLRAHLSSLPAVSQDPRPRPRPRTAGGFARRIMLRPAANDATAVARAPLPNQPTIGPRDAGDEYNSQLMAGLNQARAGQRQRVYEQMPYPVRSLMNAGEGAAESIGFGGLMDVPGAIVKTLAGHTGDVLGEARAERTGLQRSPLDRVTQATGAAPGVALMVSDVAQAGRMAAADPVALARLSRRQAARVGRAALPVAAEARARRTNPLYGVADETTMRLSRPAPMAGPSSTRVVRSPRDLMLAGAAGDDVGISLRLEPQGVALPDGRKLTVRTEGNRVTTLIDGKEVPVGTVLRQTPDGQTYVDMLNVPTPLRRKGIGRAIFQALREEGHDLVRSPGFHTPEGQALEDAMFAAPAEPPIRSYGHVAPDERVAYATLHSPDGGRVFRGFHHGEAETEFHRSLGIEDPEKGLTPRQMQETAAARGDMVFGFETNKGQLLTREQSAELARRRKQLTDSERQIHSRPPLEFGPDHPLLDGLGESQRTALAFKRRGGTAGRAPMSTLRGIAGAGVGAAGGAAVDKENPARGAVVGAAAGAALALTPELRRLWKRSVGLRGTLGAVGDFTSRIRQSLDSFPQEKGTAAQWQAWFRDRTAVGERKAVGLDDFLSEYESSRDPGHAEGRDPLKRILSRDQVRAFFDRNAIQLEETTLGPPDPEGAGLVYKYAGYQLPGPKQNYREVLVRVPGEPVSTAGWTAKEGAGDPASGPTWDVRDERGKWVLGVPREGRTAQDAIAHAASRMRRPSGYESSHWDEPGVLFHLRMSDRLGAGGEEILHVEELQSDWHQAARNRRKEEVQAVARREGISVEEAEGRVPKDYAYASGRTDLREMVAAVDAARERHTRAARLMEEEYAAARRYTFGEDRPPRTPLEHEELSTALRQRREADPDLFAVRTELHAAEDEYARAQHAYVLHRERHGTGLPDAPFKQTDEWMGLGMKRVLEEAARGGYDRVTWTNGSQQTARYDLRHHVRTVHYDPESHELVLLDHDGEHLEVRGLDPYPKPDELPGILGAELAQKLLDSPVQGSWHTLTGEGMAVGGKGMMSFYDRMIPNWLRSYGKKIGVPIHVEPAMLIGPEGQRQPSFAVTPELRERIKQGQTLWSVLGGAGGTAAAALAGQKKGRGRPKGLLQ